MQYVIITILLFVFMLVYFKAAKKYNIIDKPNKRSSHTIITLRGGGIIYWFAAFLYFIQHFHSSGLFFLGISILSLVSFWDDIQALPSRIRISAQFIAITIVFYQLDIFDLFPWWATTITYILSIGIINAYNFMDGINGMTGLCTLIVMGSFLYVNQYIIEFTDKYFIIYPILASIVFLFFNYRKQAKCFAGDVGSISISFWIVFLLLQLILKTDSIIWLLFLAVYGVDSVCTILHRIYLKQNIFEAHRLHFYQILCNEYKLDHRSVSLVYALLQIAISAIVCAFYTKVDAGLLFVLVLLPLILIYLIKFYLIHNYETKIN